MLQIATRKQNTWCRLCHTLVTKVGISSSGTAKIKCGKESVQSCNFTTGASLEYSAQVQRKLSRSEIPVKHTTGLYTENPYMDEDVREDDPLVQSLFNGLMSGERAALARSITLVESTHPRKRAQSQVLLSLILKHTQKNARKVT